MKKNSNEKSLGMNTDITRRDFVGGALLGSGAALLAMQSPQLLRQASAQTMNIPLSGVGPEWTGPGGLGDYKKANGNTHEVINAAHAAIRNREFDRKLEQALDSDDLYDLVVVGGGFTGTSATLAYTIGKPEARCLILDNHAIFGGEAKQNEFEVDGTHLWAPQGSHGTMVPISVSKEWDAIHYDFWEYCGLPDEFEWQELTGTDKDIKVPWDVYSPMGFAWEQADTGFFYEGHGFVRNPMQNGFRDAPIPCELKTKLTAAELNREAVRRPDWETWMDSMSYAEFLKVRGVDSRVTEFLDPYVAAVGLGLGCDAISAYGAYNFLMPHTIGQFLELGVGDPSDRSHLMSFPGGNGGVLRHFVKKLIPDAIPGSQTGLQDVLFNRVNFSALDRPGQPVRMRLSATVMDVRHEKTRGNTEVVRLTYLKDGKLYRVRARNVVMACGQWVNKRVVQDLPSAYYSAMDFFQHAPMLTLNVAVRNWKYMDKLGIAAARWFEGFGWWLSLKRQVLINGQEPMPLDPNKPTVFTLYIPFPVPGLPAKEQSVAARMKLFSMSFRDIEMAVRDQFTKMFSPHGFDPKRDIAGIVANRWGHAYVVPQPGFFFGKNGNPAPKDVIREPVGRVAFAHSELSGMQVWPSGAREGERAAKQLLG